MLALIASSLASSHYPSQQNTLDPRSRLPQQGSQLFLTIFDNPGSNELDVTSILHFHSAQPSYQWPQVQNDPLLVIEQNQ